MISGQMRLPSEISTVELIHWTSIFAFRTIMSHFKILYCFLPASDPFSSRTTRHPAIRFRLYLALYDARFGTTVKGVP